MWTDSLRQNYFSCLLLLPKVNYALFLSECRRRCCANILNVARNIKTEELFAPLCGSEQMWALKKFGQFGPSPLRSSFTCILTSNATNLSNKKIQNISQKEVFGTEFNVTAWVTKFGSGRFSSLFKEVKESKTTLKPEASDVHLLWVIVKYSCFYT